MGFASLRIYLPNRMLEDILMSKEMHVAPRIFSMVLGGSTRVGTMVGTRGGTRGGIRGDLGVVLVMVLGVVLTQH